MRAIILLALLLATAAPAPAKSDDYFGLCEISIRRVGSSGGYIPLLRIEDSDLHQAIADALIELPKADKMPERYYMGYNGLYIAFVGSDCEDARHLWLHRGFVEVGTPGAPTSVLKDVKQIEKRVFESASKHERWSLGTDPYSLYIAEEDACGLSVTASLYSGLPNPSVSLTAFEAFYFLRFIEGLTPVEDPDGLPFRGLYVESISDLSFGGIYLESVSRCTPFPYEVQLHKNTIIVKEDSETELYYEDEKGLRAELLNRYPKLRGR